MAAVRLLIMLAILGGVSLLVFQRHADSTAPSAIAPGYGGVALGTNQVPGAYRSLLSAQGSPQDAIARNGGLPGLGAVKRLVGGGEAELEDPGARPFADVGSRRAVASVKRDVRRNLRVLGVRVEQFNGVFVAGRRALALVDYRRVVQSYRGARRRVLPVQRRQVTLAREGGRWRFVKGFER